MDEGGRAAHGGDSSPDRDAVEDLEAEQDRLSGILDRLDGRQWCSPSAAEGWSVADVVLHLAQSEEFVVASFSGATSSPGAPASGNGGFGAGTDAGGGMDATMDRLVQSQRAEPEEVLARWESARHAALAALRAADPAVAVPWAAAPLRPRTLATTRLAEHWAHGLDVTGPLRIPFEDTARLWHVARLAHRSLPYAFSLAGEPAPAVFCELTAPDGDTWRFGSPDAATRVRGPAGDFCRVWARRLVPERSHLVADGPRGGRVLELLRNYAA